MIYATYALIFCLSGMQVVEKNGTSGSSIGNLDLGLGLEGQDNLDSSDQDKETHMMKRGSNTKSFGRWVDT